MKAVIQCMLPIWKVEGIKKIAKKNDLTVSDITRMALHFWVLNYKGKFDAEAMDRLEFEARKKIEG